MTSTILRCLVLAIVVSAAACKRTPEPPAAATYDVGSHAEAAAPGPRAPTGRVLSVFVLGTNVRVTSASGRLLGETSVDELTGWLAGRDDLRDYAAATISANAAAEHTTVVKATNALLRAGIADVHAGAAP